MLRSVVRLVVIGLAFVLTATAQESGRMVAITVDDLPYAPGGSEIVSSTDASTATSINVKLLAAFRVHRAPATGFVIEQTSEKLGSATSNEILRDWVRQGHDLGNHLYSHPDVNSLSVVQVEQEIERGEKSLVPVLRGVSRRPKFLRFPYNHTGETKEKHDGISAYVVRRG